MNPTQLNVITGHVERTRDELSDFIEELRSTGTDVPQGIIHALNHSVRAARSLQFAVQDEDNPNRFVYNKPRHDPASELVEVEK